MSNGNSNSSYIRSMFVGGVIGLFFIFLLFAMSVVFTLIAMASESESEPLVYHLYIKMLEYVFFASWPVFYLIGDKFTKISFYLGPPIFVSYWGILGAVIALIIDNFFLPAFRKRKTNIDTSE